ncbi:MAG: hypothetical protein GX607_02330 [Myxococcales bacterium]|jgi:hypothetical protein|nr:hypothetical protein [Myxococcales bacterium]
MARLIFVSSIPLLLLTSLLPACTAHVGAETVQIPSNSASICARQCRSIGLQVTAVAIMANNVGCVCQHGSQASVGSDLVAQSSTTAAGMSTIMMQDAAQDSYRQQTYQASTTSP